jgi:protein-S-isoprenylcysteine O-methyltransferase Ste14
MIEMQIFLATYLLIALIVLLIIYSVIPVITLTSVHVNLLGQIPMVAGIMININADGALQKAGNTVKPFQASSALIKGSAYGVSHRQIYTGIVLLLCGSAILLTSLSPWVILPIFAVLMVLIFIQVEERILEEKFRMTWLEY